MKRTSRLLCLLTTASLFLGCAPTAPNKPPPRRDPPVQPDAVEPLTRPADLPPELDRAQRPAQRPAQAFEREVVDPEDYARPSFAELMDGPVRRWRLALQPEFEPGAPQDMQAVESNHSWWNGKATLKMESRSQNDRWMAHGYGEAHYISNGALFAKGNFRDGDMHGPWLFFNEDGSLESIRCYKQGLLDGPYATFVAGQVASSGSCVADKGVGEWHSWDVDGALSFRTFWQDNLGTLQKVWERSYDGRGRLVNLWSFRDGVVSGEVVLWVRDTYDPAGELSNPAVAGRLELSQKDALGNSHGWLTFYDKDSGLRSHDTWFEHGEQTGPFFKYGTDGQVISEGAMRAGKRHGPFVVKVGENTSYVQYDNGLRQGSRTLMAPDGTVLSQGMYQDDACVGIWQELREAGKVYAGIGLESEGTWSGRGPVDADGRFHGSWEWARADGSRAATTEYDNGSYDGTYSFYHADGQTVRMRFEVTQGTRTGTYESFYADGSPEVAGSYLQGDKTGAWLSYHANGALKSQGSYGGDGWIGSAQVGEWLEFDQQGSLCAKKVFDASGNYQGRLEREAPPEGAPAGVDLDARLPNGTWLIYDKQETLRRRMIVLNGQPAGLVQEYFPNGVVGLEGNLQGELREGLWKAYYESGQPKDETQFVAHVPSGVFRQWRPDGSLALAGQVENGKKSGVWTAYATDGTTVIKEESYGADEKLDGSYKLYHENGQLKEEGSYAAGQKSGVWRGFYEDGQPQYTGSWEAGNKLDDWQQFQPEGSPKP